MWKGKKVFFGEGGGGCAVGAAAAGACGGDV